MTLLPDEPMKMTTPLNCFAIRGAIIFASAGCAGITFSPIAACVTTAWQTVSQGWRPIRY